MRVLLNQTQIDDARHQMRAMGVSFTESPLQEFLRRLRLRRSPPVGDVVKSWDVLATLQFLQQHVAKDAPILDIGCYASEVLVALHRLGYTRLTGADLDRRIARMPYADVIRYEVCNFMKTPFADGSFRAITSISVIEHGFDGQALVHEVSRLLAPGGYFVASFDYWPEKLDTTGTTFFGMDWTIFSRQDIFDFVELAATWGLQPVGDLALDGSQAPIHCGGKDYTFGWLVLRKQG